MPRGVTNADKLIGFDIHTDTVLQNSQALWADCCACWA